MNNVHTNVSHSLYEISTAKFAAFKELFTWLSDFIVHTCTLVIK